jgi:hypothetical protein
MDEHGSFCDYGHSWAIDMGSFAAATRELPPRGLIGVVYEDHLGAAQGLRDAAPDSLKGRFIPLANIRDRLLERFQQGGFDLRHPGPTTLALLRKESGMTIKIYRFLKDRCGVSPRDLRRGVRLFHKTMREIRHDAANS